MRFVAIHGLGCATAQGWPRVARALAPDHELVALPLLGADGPTTAPRAEWGIAAQAARLAPHLRPEDVLVGHSMGGAIAVRVARRATPRALVLIEPHVTARAGFVVKPTLAIGEAPGEEVRAALHREMARIDTGEGTYAEWIARWDWRVFHHMARELAAGDGETETWIEAVAKLDIPKFLVWGGLSADAGEDEHAAALARVGVPRREVAGSAHFVPSEAPGGLAGVLREIARELG